jgi:hypothetical protein
MMILWVFLTEVSIEPGQAAISTCTAASIATRSLDGRFKTALFDDKGSIRPSVTPMHRESTLSVVRRSAMG